MAGRRTHIAQHQLEEQEGPENDIMTICFPKGKSCIMNYKNSKAHTTLPCLIILLKATLNPITHHADNLGPITHHRKPIYHPCETNGSSRHANQLLHFFVNFLLKNFLSLQRSLLQTHMLLVYIQN